ncbi:alpha/beta hydrolase [Dyella sp.]|uniref:alpha/beta fold hydrolase n=1 Tax=Dyella sp. TaxID=1869338 RepID=UPI002B48ED91|nr:alpha/beta hydrolase [Dyella sp.]HKT28694.1 alpha/beta hydrolase [Dyella sp.]
MWRFRFVLATLLILGALIATTAYADSSELLPATAYTHPQELVGVAPGRRLNLYCLGKGTPTVLFDAGMGDGTLGWRTVQGEIAKTTRACAYDRANYFFSDTVDRHATAQAAVDDMLALINQAKLGDRVILVGHSRGGLNVRLFTYEHTDRVAGLVLVDPTVTEKLSPETTANYVHKYENYLARGQQLENCRRAAQQHILQPDGQDPLKCLDTFDTQQDSNERLLAHTIRSMETQPIYQATLFSERQNLFYPIDSDGDSTDGRSIALAEHSLGHLPLVVISADWFKSITFKGTPTPEQRTFLSWNSEQMRHVAEESTRGRFIQVPSRHYVQKERPDVVIAAIEHVINLCRGPA